MLCPGLDKLGLRGPAWRMLIEGARIPFQDLEGKGKLSTKLWTKCVRLSQPQLQERLGMGREIWNGEARAICKVPSPTLIS